MIDPSIQAWLRTMGSTMTAIAEHGDAKDMYEIMIILASQADRLVTPARLASERFSIENEGILN